MKITIELTEVELARSPYKPEEDERVLEERITRHVSDLILEHGLTPGTWPSFFKATTKVEK